MSTKDFKFFRGIKGDGFEVSLEYNSELVFLHLDSVDKMNTKTFRELKRFLDQSYELFTTVGYKALFTNVPLDRQDIIRLDKMLGFKPFGYLANVQLVNESLLLVFEGK